MGVGTIEKDKKKRIRSIKQYLTVLKYMGQKLNQQNDAGTSRVYSRR
jgi:hypothetical protein